MYRNCIFDLYGTLVDISTNENKKSVWEKICEFYVFNGADYIYTELKRDYRRLMKIMYSEYPSYTCTEIDVRKLFKKLYENKGVEPNDTLIDYTCWMFRIMSTEKLKTFSGMNQMIEKLKRNNCNVYLLTNAQSIYTKKELEYLKMDDMFDGILMSSDESVMKPSEEFFDKLFNKYGIERKGSIMIGDTYSTDIAGASRYGIDSIYIDNEDGRYLDKNLHTYAVKGNDYDAIVDIILK